METLDSIQLPDPDKRLVYESGPFDRLTHYAFRFPAKFHPPVVKSLIQEYSQPGDRVLDPFCGSGSLLVEAAVAGRHAVGVDVDPVATFVSRVKTHRFNVKQLSVSVELFMTELASCRRSDKEYDDLISNDIERGELDEALTKECLWTPAIPNLFHWFRRYVILDLARIHQAVTRLSVPKTHQAFLLLCFASIIRGASNADPVPVSGLEVTSHMRRREKEGRLINPYALLDRSIRKGIDAVAAYSQKAERQAHVLVSQGSALRLATRYRRPIHAIITSPPYHNAVDYYRRHQLEMFWLGFTETQDDRLALRQRYIGRTAILRNDPLLQQKQQLGNLASLWEARIRAVSPKRADTFLHYCLSMQQAFQQFGQILAYGSPAIIVIGNSRWNGREIPGIELFAEFATPQFDLTDHSWYPIKNRYMSYTRRNGANIDKEYVLVLRRAKPE